MSYQVLARKWRPRNFNEMVGQTHVLQALINALDQQRLHQAYLFTGTRGVGKTTIARILAKALNCEQGISSKPCGACSSCQEIDQGRFVDLLEVDAASRTKVEDTRDLLDNVQYSPTRGRYKVYLIDEVHMLSTHSFNALLKTLEEPPDHVKFLLATTDPQKLPATVLSRCLQFNLKRMTPELIAQQLQHILQQEQIEAEAAAIHQLAQAADGSMRDALSLLDQAIAYGQGKLLDQEVRQMLGTIGNTYLYDLLQAVIAQDADALLAQIQSLDAMGVDYAQLLDQLLELLQQLAVLHWTGNPATIATEQYDLDTLQQMVAQLTAEDIQLYYQIALIGKRDLALAPLAKSGFIMVMLRMLAFQPADQPPAAAAPSPQKPVLTAKTLTPPAANPQRHVPINPEIPIASLSWTQLCQQLPLKGLVSELAANSEIKAWQQDKLILTLAAQHAQLHSPNLTDKLAAALSQQLGKPVKLEVEIGLLQGETPAAAQQRAQQEQQQAAVAAMQQDPIVQTFLNDFDASIRTVTVNNS